MKLWQKTFLWTLVTVMGSVIIISILILKNNFSSSMEWQIEHAYAEHEYMISNTDSNIINERLRHNSIALTTKEIVSVMNNIFNYSDNKEATAVALVNMYDETLYNNTRLIVSDELLEQTKNNTEPCLQILETDGIHYLYISSMITLETQNFIFVTRTNISEIYDLHNEQLDYAKLLGACLALGSSILLLILIKTLLRPLSTLNNNLYAIASGDYSRRLKIKGNNELSELADSMNKMAGMIEENVTDLSNIAENRRQFINNLSHEMKTPLTSILGFADIMRIKKDISDDELAEYTGIIISETKRLQNISGKLMELITVGETNLEFKEVNILDILNQIELVFRPALEKNDLTLNTDFVECTAYIDSELFKSMLFNIIDNAIKASKIGGNIYISNSFDNGRLTISVRDEGIGIEKSELKNITEPFYMVDKARSRKAGGVGLGLALCSKIADIHNATIKFESEPGIGTTVSISMRGGTTEND